MATGSALSRHGCSRRFDAVRYDQPHAILLATRACPARRPIQSGAGRPLFRKAARGAGLKNFHFHDLRHHGATMALNKGFTSPIVMALGGWKTERMMRRYAAVTDTTLRAAAEAVSGSKVQPDQPSLWRPTTLRITDNC